MVAPPAAVLPLAEGRFQAMKDVFTSYLAQGFALLGNFVGGVIAARLLLPVGRGELGQVMLWPMLFSSLGAFAIGDAIIYFAASHRVALSRVMASAFAIGTALSVILMIGGYVALPYVLADASPDMLRISEFYLIYIPLGYASFYVICAFQAIHRFMLWNGLRALLSWAYAALAILFWLTRDYSVAAFAAASLLANFAVLVAGAAALQRMNALGFRSDLNLAKGMLGYGARIHLSNLLALASQRLDQILITLWLPPAQFGFYLVAMSVHMSTTGLVTLLGSLLFPKVAAAEDDKARAEAMGPYLRLALILSLGGGLLLLVLAPWLMVWIYGAAYEPTVLSVQVFAVGTAPTAGKALLSQAFKAIGQPRSIILAEGAALAANAIALVVLIPVCGILGAAIAFVLAQALGFAVLAAALRRQLGMAILPLFTPSRRDVSFVAQQLKNVIGAP